VTDVSSVAADFLFSGKPFAVVDVGEPDGDPLTDFPMIRAGYLLRPRFEDPGPILADMLHRDPMASSRHQLRTYYLGDFPSENYAEAFLGQVRTTVAEGAARRQSA
jgi:hypothetical protein